MPRRTRLALVAGAALVVAGAATALAWPHQDAPAAPAARAAPRSRVQVAPSALATTPAPTPTPTVPHDVVAGAVPTAFTFTAPGISIKADVCSMKPVFPLDPPGEQHHRVCWVTKGFGVAPGSADSGTSYVLGHAWARDSHEVLNPLSAPATRAMLKARPTRLDGIAIRPVARLVGSTITLRTANGTLTYRVRSAYAARKLQLGSISRVVDQHIANRVVLITCAEAGGRDYDDNIVLEAYLAASRAQPRRS